MSSFKKALFTQFALIAKALSSGHRLEILEFLSQSEYSVEDLARVVGLSVANTSHHLQQLRHAGLVTSRKEGQRVYYALQANDVIELLGLLRNVAGRHLAEVDNLVDTYLRGKDQLEPVAREDLVRRAQEGSVLVLDVRPAQEYAAGHLPGAVNIGVSELSQRLAEFDRGQEIVAYCRGPYCMLAYEAVSLLRGQGFRAHRLQDGFPEWKLSGMPVETEVETE
ncbi:MAG: metalloregulator ArsR/SmtB family transcription factor [Pseudohongiellaceae bacterium]